MGACRNSFFGVFGIFLAKKLFQSSKFSEGIFFTVTIHVDKYSKYSLHPSTFVYVYYVSEATRMTGYGPD